MSDKIAKLHKTCSELKKTATHHYEDRNAYVSIMRFLYHSLLRVNTFVVYEIDLKGDLPDHELGNEFKILKPTMQELANYRRSPDLPREFYYDEIHGVKNAYILVKGDRIAYIHWVYVKGDPNRFLRLRDDTAELNYNTTLPEFRGKGLMGKMMRYINLDLRDQGFSKAYGVVNAENIPAIKSMEKAGFHVHSRIKTLGPLHRKLAL